MARPTKDGNVSTYQHAFPESVCEINIHMKDSAKRIAGTISIYRKGREENEMIEPEQFDFIVLDEVAKIESNTSYSSFFRTSNKGQKINFYPEKGEKVTGTYQELKQNAIVKQAKGRLIIHVWGILNGSELAFMKLSPMLQHDSESFSGWFSLKQSPLFSRLNVNGFCFQKKTIEGIPSTFALPLWAFSETDVEAYLFDAAFPVRKELAARYDAFISERLGEPMYDNTQGVVIHELVPTQDEKPDGFTPSEDLPS